MVPLYIRQDLFMGPQVGHQVGVPYERSGSTDNPAQGTAVIGLRMRSITEAETPYITMKPIYASRSRLPWFHLPRCLYDSS